MNYSSNHKPRKLNLDRAFKKLEHDESYYLLNNETGINVHGSQGSNVGKSTPMPANYLACEMDRPAGECYNVGRHYAPLTNETYLFTYNSNGVHFIWRINGQGVCQVVYYGCLELSADPAHAIENWRVYLKIDKICHNQAGKQLIWCDGSDTPIGQIDVEASIATNYFTTAFFSVCAGDPCSFLQMCVPEPSGCLNGDWVPYQQSDATLSNKMLDKGFKFMYRYVYYDQRASEWSDRSSLYYQDARGCFDNSEGYSRCMKFRIPIGNALVELIQFAFSDDGGLTWYIADEIEKYDAYTSTAQQWYERSLAPIITGHNFDPSDCTFEYTFCNDLRRSPIDPLQITRELNPIPRAPQGFFRIKDSLGFYNYIKGTCPVNKSETDKFTIEKDCTNVATPCNTEYVTIKVRAIIHQPSVSKNVFIWRDTGGDGVPDDPAEPAWFSTTHSPDIGAPYVYQGYDQTFSGKTRNFNVYVEGTDTWAEMEQWRGTPGFKENGRTKVGVLSGMSAGSVVGKRRDDIKNGNYYYQEGILTVPRGWKGFLRLTSHHAENGLAQNQNTSTQVYGIAPNITNYRGTDALPLAGNKNEIYFDTCAMAPGENVLDIKEFFIIEDFFTQDSSGTPLVQSSAYSGYITDKNNQPVEGAQIFANDSVQVTTDHNGFYSFYIYDGTASSISIAVLTETGCVGDFNTMESFAAASDLGAIARVDHQIEATDFINSYEAVNVPVTDCTNKPVPGVRVAISGSKWKPTGTDGIARFKLRNYATRDRQVRAIVMDRGNCFSNDCGGNCNPCQPSTPLTQLEPCFTHTTPHVVTLTPTSHINTANIVQGKSGLKHGGRYPFGFIVEGDCGRMSAVYGITYIDIPSLQESGNLQFCGFKYSSGDMDLPAWAKRLKIVRGANVNPFNLQWVVDKIERTADGKIKLTIQSLNDYNALYNFKSNTVYKYLKGDRIEFIRNGDGKPFDTTTYGVLNFLTLSPFNDVIASGVTGDADYFNQLLIADEGKLDNLTEGAIIELQTPQVSATVTTFFEICATLDVIPVTEDDGTVHGELAQPDGTFTTFDTFIVSRQIAKFPTKVFESKTPSDFWGGTSLDDTGRPHFINKFENERRYGRNITINSPTQFNYFGDLEKTLSAAEQGDVVAISVKDDKIGLAISENDNALFEISDQLLRVGSDNVIRATTADAFISNPEAKLRGKFGCSYSDIGSIYFGDGYAVYIDSTNDSFIIHDYRIAKEAGEVLTTQNPKNVLESSCSSYFRRRIREKENFNKTATNFLDHYRYAIGFNKSTGKLFLTTKSLRHAGINNEKTVYKRPNDTIIFSPVTNEFHGFASFTPEGYTQLTLNNETGCAMIVLQNSLAYIHPVISTRFNNFFGQACDWIVGITLNQFPDKIKIPLAMEVQSDTMFFVHSVTNETPRFLSEIPAARVKKNENKWNAAFLNDINSRGGLFDGANARGYYINVLLVRDNTLGDFLYRTSNPAKQEAYSELDSILIKFMTSESSGQTENL